MDNKKEKLFEFALENGILDLGTVQDAMNKKEKERILAKHPYDIWQGKDNRWRTWVSDSTKKSGRRLIAKSSKAKIIEALLDYYDNDENLGQVTLRTLYPKWKEYKLLKGSSETYLFRIESDWKTYYSKDPIIDIPIKNLSELFLEEWALTLIATHTLTKKQYYNITVIIRQCLDYACKKEIIPENLFRKIVPDARRVFKKTRKKDSNTQVFYADELNQITDWAWDDFRNKVKVYELAPLALLFQFQTGTRIGELCALRYDDIIDNQIIHIQRMVRRDTNTVVDHTKTDAGDRYIPLTPTALTLISAAKQRQEELGVDTSGYIFSIINGKPLTERSVADLYRKYSKRLGDIQRSSNKARKTYISRLIDANISINSIREFAGHENERTTYNNYCYTSRPECKIAEEVANALEF